VHIPFLIADFIDFQVKVTKKTEDFSFELMNLNKKNIQGKFILNQFGDIGFFGLFSLGI